MSTYTPIASQTLGSAAASVTFSSIPQGYTDLIVVVNAICASGGTDLINLQYNGDTSSGLYSSTRLVGNGSSVNSDRQTGGNFIYAGLINSTVRNSDIYQIQNYSNGTTFKTCLARASVADNQTRATVGLWRNTNAITSLTISHASSINFSAGSTFSIYGIQVGASTQKAQGGNIVTSDGTYVYHTFTSSGSFIPSQALTVDYLVVAGGGGAGNDNSGGGGAGGLRSTVTATGGGGSVESALSLSSGLSYPVIVGAGGAGSTNGNIKGVSGSNSVFSTITSIGGGGGGSDGVGYREGITGGSGGGGTGNNQPPQNWAGGSGTVNQGYAGGTGYGSSGGGWLNHRGGGGGGAGAAGVAGNVSSTGGNGGNGVAVAISGSSVYYAGGGAGGTQSTTASTGGLGGGGNGGSGNPGSAGGNGTTNLGGGGAGGGGSGGNGGSGGSGVVIIRYAL